MDYQDNQDQYNPHGLNVDPNAGMQKPLTATQNPMDQLMQMKNAAGNAVTWFQMLTSYVEKNPGIALAVGAGIVLMALSAEEGKGK